jgi:iron complex transport system substrate-binding protein
MPSVRSDLYVTTRRSLLAAGAGTGLGAVLAACVSGNTTAAGTTAAADATSSGPWTFTDDRKKKVTLSSAPTRVVAYVGTAAALYDFGVTVGAAGRIVGVFGPTKLADGAADPLAGGIDVNKVAILGNAWGEFDVEKYAALRPEVLATNMLLPNALWYVPDASQKQIAALAPTIGLTVADVSMPEPLARYAELAGRLGADLKAAKVTDAKARFQKAAQSLRAAAKENGGIRVMAASAAADLLYISDPKPYPDLSYFEELGVTLVKPNNVSGGFFESLSWENADKYRADLILLDSRTAALQPKDLTGKPTWTALPAVKAEQVVPWLSEPRYSYAACAPVLEAVAKAVQNAKKVA